MAYEQVTRERRGRVGIVTLIRPDRLNAFSQRLSIEMRAAIDAGEPDFQRV